MSCLKIDLSVIKNNIQKTYAKGIVCKSNFYGLGYELLKYIMDDVEILYVSTAYEYKEIEKYLSPQTNVVILYPRETDFRIYKNCCNVYLCINSFQIVIDLGDEIQQYNNLVLRIDDLLGLHGIPGHSILNDSFKFNVKKILLHINEWVSDDEKRIIFFYYQWAKKRNITFSIGGTTALELFSDKDDVEIRIAAKLLESTQKSPICLITNIINTWNANQNPVVIGYKSDCKMITSGCIFLVDIGYGDWPLLARIYEKQILLKSDCYTFSIPVYPCMNTTWLLCSSVLEDIKELHFFKNISDVKLLCEELNIDFDEFTTSFNASLERIYLN